MSTQEVFGQVFGMESWIAAAVFAAVVSIVVLAAYRYRDRPGREVSTMTKANAVETAFALVLFAFAIFLTVDTASAGDRETKPTGVAPLHVDVLAYQWNWRFTYPGPSITVNGGAVGHRPTLEVPVGRPVEISLRSNDVVHEFWVPDLDYKMQAFPDHVNHFTITATKAGTWVGRCAVYCGQFHFEMDFLLQAVSPAEFASWSAAHQGASI